MRPLASTPSNICRRESFLSGSHFSAVFASFSRLSPPFGSLVAYPVGNLDKKIADKLGLTSLYILEAFPLLLAAIGYSRVYSAPKPDTTTRLRPFITNRPKIPLYAVRSTTEALMFELDPWREAAWLLENDLVEAPDSAFADECHLRLWLL